MKKTLQIGLWVVVLLGPVKKNYAQLISDHFFGVNAWMPDTIGNVAACPDPPCIRYGKLHNNWDKVKDSKTSIVRYGGISPDKNMPTNYQYLRMVDSIQANGMEPVIQVPFYNGRYTAQQAADVVKYLNIIKGRNVKYWVIGNEPNLIYSYTTAAQIAAYFKTFASAMKAVDPSILIVGPETASFKKTITDGLTTPNGPDDITGKDAAGRYYLDVFSFHTYPMGDGNLSTRAKLISELTEPGAFQDDVNYVNSRLTACNTAHNRTGASKLKLAITETNVNYNNNASDNLNGFGVNSFIGGQFVAELYGIGLKCGVDFMNLWSVIEGANSVEDNCGYIDAVTGNKKPVFYHFQMMAENFKGNSVNCTDNQTNVKAFASQDADEVCVLIMNEDLTSNYNYTVRLNTNTISGNDPLKINVNANIASDYNDVLPNQSSVLLVFNSAGTISKKIEYSLMQHAVNNLPPASTNFITTSVVSSGLNNANESFDIKVFPNPSPGKFTIEVNKKYGEEKNFEIRLVNLLGQEVYNRKTVFSNKQEVIELDESVAHGVYILQVEQEDDVATKRIIINK